MNAVKKHEKMKHQEATKNLNKRDKEIYDKINSLKSRFEALKRELHSELFSEEFDYMYDSGVDANERKKGINPMSEEHIEKVNTKRKELGFMELSPNGQAQDTNDTLNYCKQIIVSDIDFKKKLLLV